MARRPDFRAPFSGGNRRLHRCASRLGVGGQDTPPDDGRRAPLDSRRSAQAEGAAARMSSIALDPLFAEAKRRARSSDLIALAMGVVMLGAVAAYAIAYGGRSS